ncbi:MAG: alpha-glucan family phosphorylase [Nitrospiraceae bacterium]|nr:alpha-glucan family phosphorylase [Nitrospiraceae bacterium]
MNSVKDPVCGMMLPLGEGLSVVYQGQEFRFCSDLCKRTFLATPERYAGLAQVPGSGDHEPSRRIAYFSMEIAVESGAPTYSGGLGVLASDMLRSCADLKIPVVGVSLLYWKGYFDQILDDRGNQQEHPVTCEPSRRMKPLSQTVQVVVENRSVVIRAWQYDLGGATGFTVPVLFLDTNIEENAPQDRELTFWLYGGDEHYRLAQEIVLGIGGVRMLRAMGHTNLERFHMNEGHAALLAVELLQERRKQGSGEWDFNGVRRQCIFTTHTPVPAGHDQFSYDLVLRVLGEPLSLETMQMLAGRDRLNMTLLGLNMSAHVNGVAKRHSEISQEMFPGYPIDSITNGIHSVTWTCESFQHLYDRYIPGWRIDSFALRHALNIPNQEIWHAHMSAKARLLKEAERQTQRSLSTEALTIGFARRATLYKRMDLVFRDLGQLLDIAKNVGPIQFVFAGKAHPKDEPGKEMIRRVIQAGKDLKNDVAIVYLQNYDVELAKLITSGVDLWMNTPLRPLEASGTSGMKAAHNGVPSLSVLDGWWIEGQIEGVTGWSIGPGPTESAQTGDVNARDANELYQKLRWMVAPLYYRQRERWVDVMRHTIAINASFFNTHRMVQQYAANVYL